MKKLFGLAFAGALLAGASGAAFAAEYTKGLVTRVDAAAGKVTVDHEELKNLDMPAMTMVFRTASEEMLRSLEEGQQIEFVAERVNGRLTIVDIRQ